MTDSADPIATGAERLVEAAKSGRVDEARRLLDAHPGLLSRGASSNPTGEAGKGEPAMPALYWATVGNHVALARLLLERGADPNDGESIYHGAELDHREILELLLAHGADVSNRHPHWDNTPLYFLAGYHRDSPQAPTVVRGVQWLLEHGADPDVTSYAHRSTPLHQVIRSDGPLAFVDLLLAHGADPAIAVADGRTAWVLAVRSGNREVMARLEAAGGAVGTATPADTLLGAAARGDAAAARAVLDSHEGLLERLTADDRSALAHAAAAGRADAVRALLAIGFDPAWEGHGNGSALHWAAWFGRPDCARLLLDAGAVVHVRDHRYGSSPIAWAGHGSHHCRVADADYIAVVDMLAAAGSTPEAAFNHWGQAPDELGSPAVDARLRELGFTRRKD